MSRYVGNVFGAPLAIETLVAFFLEATFLGMWIFGWHRLRRGVHLALLWGVALTAYASAFWIMVANSWLQHPVGYEVRDGIAHLTDFGALLTNPTLGFALGHVVSASLVTGGMLMAAVSAWQLIRRTPDFVLFRTSLRIGLITAALAVPTLQGFGFAQFGPVGQLQPTKFGDGPTRDALVAEWTATFGPGDYTPPALSNVGLGFMILVLGWIAREVGRQPWVAYGLLPTGRAVSPVGAGVMLTSLVGFTLLLGTLAVTNWVLLARHAARGAADSALGRPPAPDTDTRPAPVFA